MGTRFNYSDDIYEVSPNIVFHLENDENKEGNLYVYTEDETCYLLNGLNAKALLHYLYIHGHKKEVKEILDLLIKES